MTATPTACSLRIAGVGAPRRRSFCWNVQILLIGLLYESGVGGEGAEAVYIRSKHNALSKISSLDRVMALIWTFLPALYPWGGFGPGSCRRCPRIQGGHQGMICVM